jgi:hypothetical protein
VTTKKNQHTYEVSEVFQAWWETMVEKPQEATMEKMLAWKAWEERGRRKLEEMHGDKSELIQ